MTNESVTVIGGGLAGCEAAWQLARCGVRVTLVEMKPGVRTPAHSSDLLGELVCSNSLRGTSLSSAVGLLKEELRRSGSLLIACAEETSVPAGRALAVDRLKFSQTLERSLESQPLIQIVRERREDFTEGERVIVATGPLSDGGLLDALERHGATLNYHDAIAPLIAADSVDRSRVFLADRYEDPKSGGAYLNCPFAEREYYEFVRGLVDADKTPLNDFESAPFFEGCLPVEEMAARGPLTLAYGPLKPVGLTDPRTGRRPFAVAQLRPEDRAATAYSLVGFQTRLTRPEQRRVLRSIPGLEQAVFERYGQVHRNTFVDAPRVLDDRLRLIDDPAVSLAGQLTGVEGYVESIASGLFAGLAAAAELAGEQIELPPVTTALGGLMGHTRRGGSYQPSNVVWAMIETEPRRRGQQKRDHREVAATCALEDSERWKLGWRKLIEI
ncbi:MAG: methylenetetrahydrofolate--tRNA-(uracil(54)-C(5))-methyltransferase (FADH(2)-oxidizing) TrmFO [Deltaproteobacteria bacterium]|nr:methylenetetrahydrofolate--tRNA-(uracil(54)-C(5))-methyltransferase (FADH(2)-oxidizing) TrmFO [Deltaproteobacteria bacterium]